MCKFVYSEIISKNLKKGREWEANLSSYRAKEMFAFG